MCGDENNGIQEVFPFFGLVQLSSRKREGAFSKILAQALRALHEHAAVRQYETIAHICFGIDQFCAQVGLGMSS